MSEKFQSWFKNKNSAPIILVDPQSGGLKKISPHLEKKKEPSRQCLGQVAC